VVDDKLQKDIDDQSRTGFEANLCPYFLLLTICHNTVAVVVPALPENDMDVLQIET